VRTRLAVAIAAALFVVPGSASAATVSLSEGGDEEAATLTYTAAPGETNRPNVTVTGSTAEVNDPGTNLTPGAGCTPVNAKRVTCALKNATARIQEVSATLLDENDRFNVTGARSDVDGGTGNDNLRGGEQADSLRGGGGNDDLDGGAGPDTLSDGDTTGAANRDDIDGGTDVDSVSYSTRTAPVIVDLAAAGGDGEAGENENLKNIENATGGSGDDSLSGTDGVNSLNGGRGRDFLDGRSGNDLISGGDDNDTAVGGAGRDDIETGAGDDVLRLENPAGTYDRLLVCGDGKDLIVGIAAAPSVAIDCELGDFGFGFVAGLKPKKVGTTSVTVKIPCPDAYRKDGACKGSVVVEPKSAYLRSDADRKKQRFGAAKFKITKSSGKVTIKMNSRGRKELKKSAFKLQFHINLKETATGTKRQFEWTSYLVRQFL
jgi:Ca2+-binding RTX toxin-like protein